MKKIISSKLLLILIFVVGSNQFVNSHPNYYNNNDYITTNTVQTATNGSVLTIDEFNKIYFIGNSGIVYGIYYDNGWIPFALNSGAVAANPAGGLVYRNYHLYYVGVNNKVCCFYYQNSTWNFSTLNWNAPNARPNSKLAVDDFDKVYYIGFDGLVYNLIYDPSNIWNYNVLDATAPHANIGSDLVYKNYKVYYIDNNLHIQYYYYDNNSWHWDDLNNSIQVSSNSSLAVDEYDKVYFINANQIVCNAIYNGPGNPWNIYSLNLDAVHATVNSPLTYNKQRIFYFGEDRKTHVLFWDNERCGWFDNPMHATLQQFANINSIVVDSFDKCYFVGSDRYIHVLYNNINPSDGYVYVKGNDLMLNDKIFYPKVINYLADINVDNVNNEYFLSPTTSYDLDFDHLGCNSSGPYPTCMDAIRDHFTDINKLGFNTIRLIGFGISASADPADGHLYYRFITKTSPQTWTFVEVTPTMENLWIDFIKQLCYEADQRNLKIILCTGFGMGVRDDLHTTYANYLDRISAALAGEKALVAYDVYNEPGNFENKVFWPNITKGLVCNSSKLWYESIRKNTKQLVTMGTDASDAVLVYDPALLSVDFYSFHMYPWPSLAHSSSASFEAVNSEIKWISTNIPQLGKPWMVGETGFNANIDGQPSNFIPWGDEQAQEVYARATIERVINCGGAGYTWWQYHDVFWDNSNDNPYWSKQDYLGLYAHDGTPKAIIRNNTFSSFAPLNKCNCPETNHYYNYFDEHGYTVEGTITNSYGKPIGDDAVIIGVCTDGNHKTFTDKNGHYILETTQKVNDIWITALHHETKRIDAINPNGNNPITFDYQLNEINCNPEYRKSSGNIIETEVNSIFPNPAENEINVFQGSDYKGNVNYKLYDSIGNLVMDGSLLFSKSFKIDISKLKIGIYILEIQSSEKTVFHKLIKI
jgi:hypothetical protein